MPLSRVFKEGIRARVQRDPKIRKAFLRMTMEYFLHGDVESGKLYLRRFIHATMGFAKLSETTQVSAKSLMRMLGPSGNPQARNLFAIIKCLQEAEGLRLVVRVRWALRPRSSQTLE